MGRLSTTQCIALAITVPAAVAILYLLYKRQEEDEQTEDVTIGRHKVIEMKVPHDMVGSVIGRQGSNIKAGAEWSDSPDRDSSPQKDKSSKVYFLDNLEEPRVNFFDNLEESDNLKDYDGYFLDDTYEIQEKSGARVNFRDETGLKEDEDRVVVIRGKEEDAQEAERLIREHIAIQPVIETVEVMVPQRAIGRIIGRNGNNIRSMCRISKARIKVDHSEDERDPNGQQTITIKGTMEQVQNAKGLIEEKVAEEEEFRRKLETAAANRRPRSPKPKKDGSQLDDLDLAPQRTAKKPAVTKFEMSGGGLPPHSDFFEVYVSAVETAGHFWVQVLGQKSQHLDYLVQTMTDYYSSPENRKTEIPFSIGVGDIVSVPFKYDDSWYRAKVTGLESDGKFPVYYVDFGDSGDVEKELVFTLRSDFLGLPFQAVECFLADVEPVGEEWTEVAIDMFEDLCYCAKWKVLMARILSYKQTDKGLLPCVELIDTNGPQDLNINKKMIAMGYAVNSPKEASQQNTSSPRRARYGGKFRGKSAMKFPPSESDTMEALSQSPSKRMADGNQGSNENQGSLAEGDSPRKSTGANDVAVRRNVLMQGCGEPAIAKDVEFLQQSQSPEKVAAVKMTAPIFQSASTPMKPSVSSLSEFVESDNTSPIHSSKDFTDRDLEDKWRYASESGDQSAVSVLDITSSTAADSSSSSSNAGLSCSISDSLYSNLSSSMQGVTFDDSVNQSVASSVNGAYSENNAVRKSGKKYHCSEDLIVVSTDTDCYTPGSSHGYRSSSEIDSFDVMTDFTESLLLADESSLLDTSTVDTSYQSSVPEDQIETEQRDSLQPTTSGVYESGHSPTTSDEVSGHPSNIDDQGHIPSTSDSKLTDTSTGSTEKSPLSDDSVSYASALSKDISSPDSSSFYESTSSPADVSAEFSEITTSSYAASTVVDTTLSAGDPNSSLPPESDSILDSVSDSSDSHPITGSDTCDEILSPESHPITGSDMYMYDANLSSDDSHPVTGSDTYDASLSSISQPITGSDTYDASQTSSNTEQETSQSVEENTRSVPFSASSESYLDTSSTTSGSYRIDTSSVEAVSTDQQSPSLNFSSTDFTDSEVFQDVNDISVSGDVTPTMSDIDALLQSSSLPSYDVSGEDEASQDTKEDEREQSHSSALSSQSSSSSSSACASSDNEDGDDN